MVALTVGTGPVASLPVDCVVIGVAEGPKGPVPAPGAEAVTAAFDGPPSDLLAALGATGAEGEAIKLPAPAGIAAGLVLAVGLGAAAHGRYEPERLRRGAGVAARSLAGAGTADAVARRVRGR